LSFDLKHNSFTPYEYIINSTGPSLLDYLNFTFYPGTINEDWLKFHYYSGPSGHIHGNNIYIDEEIKSGSYRKIDVNISIPEFADAGIYEGFVILESSIADTKNYSFRIEVLANSSWVLLTSDYQAKNVDVIPETFDVYARDSNRIGNVTIHNMGNMPLNFSVDYLEVDFGGYTLHQSSYKNLI